MKIRREIFHKYKNGVWLIKLKKDKYLHIPKPKTSIKYLFRFLKGLILLPIGIIINIFEALIESLEDLPLYISEDIFHPFKLIFPNIINVVDEGFNWVENVKMLENDK